MDPNEASLLVRHLAYDWKKEVDARLALKRLDASACPAVPLALQELAKRLGDLDLYTYSRVIMWREHIRKQREMGRVNKFEPSAFIGGVAGQQ